MDPGLGEGAGFRIQDQGWFRMGHVDWIQD